MNRTLYEALMRAAKDLEKHPEYWTDTTYCSYSGARCLLTHLIGPANVPKDYCGFMFLRDVKAAARRHGFEDDELTQIIQINDHSNDPSEVVDTLREEFG